MSLHAGLMSPAEFLHHVWPETGIYALATPFTIPNTTLRTYAHRTFATIDAAAQYAAQSAPSTDVYFAVHTLKEARVWNPTKIDRKTGAAGAYEIRTQANMAAATCLFLDLDVGDSDTKYASPEAAIIDLKRFCTETQLPRPTIVSSGGGLHVYWVFDRTITSDLWRPLAATLRQLVRAHHLRADPARTTDPASVLRVAGTQNHKRQPMRAVQVLTVGAVTSLDLLTQRLRDAEIRAGVTPAAIVARPLQTPDLSGLGSNLTPEFDGPPVTMKALLTVCAQVRHVAQRKGNVSEPEWYHTLNLVRFVGGGERYVHRISDGYPQYTPDETNRKVQQLKDKNVQPTSCTKLAEFAGEERCTTCAFFGKVKSPLVAARMTDPAPAVTVIPLLGATTTPQVIPPPPKPYTRMKGGGISVAGQTKEGDEIHTVIYGNDLYPLRRLVNAASGTEQQAWCVVFPREGPKEFLLDADALYDRKKFAGTIANHGIYPVANSMQFLQDYMIAYITELQKLVDAEAQCNHLGWSEQHTCFIFPDKVLYTDGQVKPAQLSVGAARASAQVHRLGDLPAQVTALDFYRNPAYLPNQFFILASLAAPIFYMTGHHGVIINASGDAGASKSTTLYAAASLWGQPELYPINGTNNGATVRGRNERVTTLANLPVCVDEITHMPVRDAVDLAMSITQPGHRIRLTNEGVERRGSGSLKATMMLTTANNSLHGALSMDNAAGTAGSMRVVEILFKAAAVHAKHEADAFLHGLKQHFGHIGERFVAYIVTHMASVAARVREAMKTIDTEANIQPSERFWSAAIAAVVVAGEIAQQLGLLHYDAGEVRQWAVETQIPYMRGVVNSEYTTPVGMMAEYLEHINGDILVAAKPHNTANIANVMRTPRGQLLAHYDIEDKKMWVLKKGFKDYCARTGANFAKTLDELNLPRPNGTQGTTPIVTSKHVRKVLGSGTEHAKAQSWCFVLDMAHTELSGAVDLGILAGGVAAPVKTRRVVGAT